MVMARDSQPDNPNQALLQSNLELRGELRFRPQGPGSDRHFVIEDPIRNKFFRAGEKECLFLRSLTGRRSVNQVAAELAAAGTEYTEPELISICQWLIQNNLVNGFPHAANLLTHQAANLAKQKLIGSLNPICFKWRLPNPDPLIRKIEPYSRWLFSPAVAVVWLIASLVSCWILWTRWEQVQDTSQGILAPHQWLCLLGIWVALKVIHELAHGVACRMFGGEVKEAGVLLLLFTPLAYVDVTSCWRFHCKRQRMIVAAAGMYVELFVAFLGLIAWAQLPSGQCADFCFQVFMTGSITTLLFNANPLMRFDGYYLLSDALNIPNLYSKGMAWFADRLRGWILGTRPSPAICPAAERLTVACYGILAFVWKLLISVGLIIAASVLFDGLGLILGLIGTLWWIGLPLGKQLQLAFGKQAPAINRVRLTISMAAITLFGVLLFTLLRGPAIQSAPAVVQFKNEAILRAESDGFIEQIFVRNGELVASGTKLIQLRNRTLEAELRKLSQLIEEATIQARIYRQDSEIDKAQAEQEKRAGLLKQRREKQRQVDAMTVVAPISGIVFHPDLEHRTGSFAVQGDILVTVADPRQKKVLLSVDQANLKSLQSSIGAEFQLVIPGVPLLKAELARINPRASDRPSHLELCAAYGGPIPVKQVATKQGEGETGFQLLSPRFTAELELLQTDSDQLYAGQRGRALFRCHSQSLGAFLFLQIESWLKSKVEQATQTAVF